MSSFHNQSFYPSTTQYRQQYHQPAWFSTSSSSNTGAEKKSGKNAEDDEHFENNNQSKSKSNNNNNREVFDDMYFTDGEFKPLDVAQDTLAFSSDKQKRKVRMSTAVTATMMAAGSGLVAAHLAGINELEGLEPLLAGGLFLHSCAMLAFQLYMQKAYISEVTLLEGGDRVRLGRNSLTGGTSYQEYDVADISTGRYSPIDVPSKYYKFRIHGDWRYYNIDREGVFHDVKCLARAIPYKYVGRYAIGKKDIDSYVNTPIPTPEAELDTETSKKADA